MLQTIGMIYHGGLRPDHRLCSPDLDACRECRSPRVDLPCLPDLRRPAAWACRTTTARGGAPAAARVTCDRRPASRAPGARCVLKLQSPRHLCNPVAPRARPLLGIKFVRRAAGQSTWYFCTFSARTQMVIKGRPERALLRQTGSVAAGQRTSANGGVLRTTSSASRHSNGAPVAARRGPRSRV